MDQEIWSQKQQSSTIIKLRVQKCMKINIERNIKKAQGRCKSHMEILHVMLEYP